MMDEDSTRFLLTPSISSRVSAIQTVALGTMGYSWLRAPLRGHAQGV